MEADPRAVTLRDRDGPCEVKELVLRPRHDGDVVGVFEVGLAAPFGT